SDPTMTGSPPLGAFGNYQSTQLQGINSDRPSLLVKRAWGEVAIPLGILKFGRMPNQWGLGIYANSGDYDPINGTYDYDADFGDSVDRVSFSAVIPGTPLRAMIAADWNLTRLVSNQANANPNIANSTFGYGGHPFNLDNSDNSNGWVGVISKIDSPQ